MKKTDSHKKRKFLAQTPTMSLFVSGLFITIVLEIFSYSFLQSSLSTYTDGILQRLSFICFFIILIVSTSVRHDYGICGAYITFLKFIELIPIVIDLINLLFIYRYKMKDTDKQNSLIRLRVSLILMFIRFMITLDIIRRQCDCQWKRQMIVIFDLLLFILVNIALLRDSYTSFIRIGQKIFLGLIIIRLNNLLCNANFWIEFNNWNDRLTSKTPLQRGRFNMRKMFCTILLLRWILSSFIICLYIISIFDSIIIDENERLFSINYIIIYLKALKYDAVICMTIVYIIFWDTIQSENTLNRNGVSCFCIGFHVVSEMGSTEIPLHSPMEPTTTVIDDIRWVFFSTNCQK
jgi:hypothetical protein